MLRWTTLYVALVALFLLPNLVHVQTSPQRVVITPENVQQIKEVATLGRGWVQGLVWSPDKRLLAVVSSTGVWLYDVTNPTKGPRQFPIEYFKDFQPQLPYFSPDGSRLVTVEYCRIIVWDVASTNKIAEYSNPCDDEPVDQYVVGIYFDKGGRTLVVSYIQGTGYVVDDLDSHARLYTLAIPAGQAYFSPDALHTAICGYSSFVCQIWDLATGKLLITLNNYEDPIWSPDGDAIANQPVNGEPVQVWFAADSYQVEIKGQHGTVTWSPNNNLLATDDDLTTYIWDAHTGKEVAHLNRIFYEGYTFSADSTALIGLDPVSKVDNGYGAVVWKFGSNSPLVTFNSDENEGWGAYLAVSPDGQSIATASYSDLVRVWSLSRPDDAPITIKHSGVPESLAFSPDSKTLAVGMGSISTIDQGSWDNSIWLWKTADDSIYRILDGHINRVMTLDYSPDGQYLVSGAVQDDGSKFWKPENYSMLISMGGEALGIGAVLRPDEREVAIGNLYSDGTTAPVVWYSVPFISSSNKRPPTGLSSRPIAFSNDGTLLAVGGRVYDANTDKLKFSLFPDFDWWYMAFSPDDRYVAVGDQLWDVQTQTKIASWKVDDEFYVAFSPDGRLLAAGGAGNLQLIDVARKQVIMTLRTPGNADIHSIAWSPDGKTLAVGSWEGTVRLWGVEAEQF